jgi:hypothetical protein
MNLIIDSSMRITLTSGMRTIVAIADMAILVSSIVTVSTWWRPQPQPQQADIIVAAAAN